MSEHDTDEVITPIQEVEIVGATDWFLRQTIETVIAHGVEIGVTLAVGGSIISGILVSGKTYFAELGETLKGASKSEGDMQSVLGEAWKGYTALYEKPEGAPDDWVVPPAGYIHLRNARYFAPGQPPVPTNQGVLWRGKLSAVDGFSIGNLSAD